LLRAIADLDPNEGHAALDGRQRSDISAPDARLALIRALVREPKVLLLDEPTAALDAAAVKAVEALLCGRIKSGISALWVTHDSSQAARVADRSLAVEAGAVRESKS
jgi:ABC-type iron transport system FetAB ATPase subunit